MATESKINVEAHRPWNEYSVKEAMAMVRFNKVTRAIEEDEEHLEN